MDKTNLLDGLAPQHGGLRAPLVEGGGGADGRAIVWSPLEHLVAVARLLVQTVDGVLLGQHLVLVVRTLAALEAPEADDRTEEEH